jgi:hypothetical protein
MTLPSKVNNAIEKSLYFAEILGLAFGTFPRRRLREEGPGGDWIATAGRGFEQSRIVRILLARLKWR